MNNDNRQNSTNIKSLKDYSSFNITEFEVMDALDTAIQRIRKKANKIKRNIEEENK